jgi:dihydrofolate synthase/folylpolyglutamate synthase
MTDPLSALTRLQALHPKRIDLTLGRMERVCETLGRPQDRLPPIVHVAGTNGKGSTVAMLRAMVEAKGLRVHVYTSPHLVHFRERIRLCGTLIDDARLNDCLTRVEAANAGAPLTFFEATTAAAFVAFSEMPADLLILEVGLGGILDATNIIIPKLSIITPIDYDHQGFLGEDLTTIAAQKAGIIKDGVPVICAEQPPEALRAIDRAVTLHRAPLSLCGRDFSTRLEQGRLIYEDETTVLDLDPPRLMGAHQIANAALAIAAARALSIGDGAINAGLRSVSWPARLQPLTAGPLVEALKNKGTEIWLDGGHNPHAAQALNAFVEQRQAEDAKPLIMIIGLINTKDYAAFFRHIAPLKPTVFCVAFSSDACVDPNDLCVTARENGLEAHIAPSPLGVIKSLDNKACRIVIAGSLYLAGDVLALSAQTYPH